MDVMNIFYIESICIILELNIQLNYLDMTDYLLASCDQLIKTNVHDVGNML